MSLNLFLGWKIPLLLTRSFSNLLSRVILFSIDWQKLDPEKYMGTVFYRCS